MRRLAARWSRVAVEAALNPVVDLAGLHVAQGLTHQLEELSVASLRPTQEGEVDGFGVGELLRATPAAVLAVHGAQQGLCSVIQDLFC